MKNFKWGTESFNESPVYVVLFVSRNKDNVGVENFEQRRISFITHKEIDDSRLIRDFENFVSNGVPGETCRMYYSINARDTKKIYKDLVHFLIDEPDFNLCDIAPKLAGIAASKGNALTKHWMFDFDINDLNKANEFCDDIKAIDPEIEIIIHKTPNAYAIITNHGFDTRKLYEKWDSKLTELKRDDLVCVRWKTKEE